MPDSFIPNPSITYPGQLSPERGHSIPTASTSDGFPIKRMRSSSPSATPPSMQIHSPAPSAPIPLSHPSPIHHGTGVSSAVSVGKIVRAGSPLRFSSSVGPPLPKSGLGVESIPSGERTPLGDDVLEGGDVFGGGGVIVPPPAAEEKKEEDEVDGDATMAVV